MESANPVRQRLLVVDDDHGLRAGVADYLDEHGFAVTAVESAAAMDAAMAAGRFDAVILDVMMPGEDGLSACRRLAAQGGPAIIMLSAAGEDIDRFLGLELGADDYLSKPCNPRELLARIKAVLRRRERDGAMVRPRGGHFAFAGFQLDVARRQLQAPTGVTALLTSGELALLTAFVENPRRVLSRDELLDLSRGGEVEVYDRAMDVQISRLRRKLETGADRSVIQTQRGLGYMLDAHVTRL
jgi:two-component system OmpR family response regulator